MVTKASRFFVLCALGLTSCSPGLGDATDTTLEATTTTLAPAVLALPYFEELAKDTRVGYETAMSMAVDFAKEYAEYQNEYLQAIAYATADGKMFDKRPLQTARLDDSGRILVESAEERITFSDFSFATGKFGKLLDFKVEGRELSGNLKSGASIRFTCRTYNDECNSDRSIDAKILHSYISAAGELIVTYSVRIGSKFPSVRVDKTSSGLPNHEVVDSSGTRIKATFGIETFARGETRISVVHFGPLRGGGAYSATLKFRSDGNLLDFQDYLLGSFTG